MNLEIASVLPTKVDTGNLQLMWALEVFSNKRIWEFSKCKDAMKNPVNG